MPVLARKSGWNAARTEPFDSCSITVTLQSLGTVCWATKGSSIAGQPCVCYQGRCWRRDAPCAGAHQLPAWAPAWRQLQLALACVVPTGLHAGARCRGRPCARHPPTSRFRLQPARSYMPTALMPVAPSPAVCTAPLEALIAPGSLLQGTIKNQIWVDYWKFEWMNVVVAICSYQHVGNIWKSRALLAWFVKIKIPI